MSKKKKKKQNPFTVSEDQAKVQKIKIEDHSSKFNVLDTIKKIRSLKSIDELQAFTKGEQRLTNTKVISVAKNRLN